MVSTATIRRSTVAEFREKCLALAQADWLETTSEPELTFDPQWPIYERLEAAGSLQILVAELAGTIVGYSVSMLVPDLRMPRVLLQADAVYVDPPMRRHGVGDMLRHATIERGRELGATVFATHAKEGSAWERILRRDGSGFRVREVIFSMELADG